MNVIKDGGPAFPGGERWRTVDLSGNENNHSRAPYNNGLSLRDYFAARAMQQILASSPGGDDQIIAGAAYQMADAMLAAREAQP